MKRRSTLLTCTIGFVSLSYAQPTIPQVSLAVGDVLVIDASFPITDAGPGGTNVTWNYASPGFSGTQWTYTAQTAASTPYAASYPAATMALNADLTSGSSGYFYFDFNGGFTEHGEWITDGVDGYPDIYTDPITYFTTPLTTTSSGSDTYASVTGIAGMGELFANGTHTWTVDGYGTLILPNATYTDVLRVHGVQNEVNTIVVSGIEIEFEVLREEWWWVKAGIPFPLLVFSEETEDGETNVAAQGAVISFNGATSINDMAELPMRVYPNPVRDVVTMELEATGTVHYRVLDALGREVLQGSIPAAGTMRHSINVATLTAGPYHLEVRSAEGMATQGLIIE